MSAGAGATQLLVLAWLLPAVAAAMPAEPEVPPVPEAVEEILQEPAEQEYTESPRCVSTNRIRDVRVLDGEHVVFQTGRDTYQLVQFRRRCPLLRRNSTIVYEARSSRLCVLDSLRAMDGVGLGGRPGPPCQIPSFQTINAEQLQLLQDTLEQQRGSEALTEPAEQAAEPDATDFKDQP